MSRPFTQKAHDLLTSRYLRCNPAIMARGFTVTAGTKASQSCRSQHVASSRNFPWPYTLRRAELRNLSDIRGEIYSHGARKHVRDQVLKNSF